MNKTLKKVLNIITYVVLVLVILMSIMFISVSISTRSNDAGLPSLFGKSFFTVQSNSMNAVIDEKTNLDWDESWYSGFKKGDLVVVKLLTEDSEKLELKVGDIVTFTTEKDNKRVLNTHRLIAIDYNYSHDDGSIKSAFYTTKGDNESQADLEVLSMSDIRAVYTGKKLGGVGNFIDFMKKPAGFIVLIVLPLGLFFVYRLIILIKVIMDMKKEKAPVTGVTAQEHDDLMRQLEELKAQMACINTNQSQQQTNSASQPVETAVPQQTVDATVENKAEVSSKVESTEPKPVKKTTAKKSTTKTDTKK